MLAFALLLAGSIQGAGPGDPHVYAGRAGQTAVKPPRLDGAATIDGVLDEPQWQQAAILTGFSEFTPVDGVAASDSTEVRIWYSSTALYIGVKALDKSGAVHATVAARDQIFNDDNVQIYLSTFNDGRQATLFAVNPLGIQGDGAVNENGSISCNGMSNCATQTRQPPNLSPDFVWESKGHVTPDGYQVEIRIPFRSIRFQQAKTQTWGLNVLRVVQRSGEEQTWTATRRGASSFLAQSGQLEGLTDLDAGHVLDVVPTVTSRVDYGPPPGSRDWQTSGGSPQIGGDLRYGLTHNLTLNATAHPDFSQVESDVPQFAFDPRQAIFYPEKRPFFLEGAEQFDAPFGLIYTRRIVQPVFASKLTGKTLGTQIGVLAAVDDRLASNFGDNPVFLIARLARDLGPGSRVGLAWTEQHDGPETNRVGGFDGRIVFGKVNSIAYQGAFAHDDNGTTTNNGDAWAVSYHRDGAHFRMNYGFSGISPDFITRSGFIGQAGVGNAQLSTSYTWLRQHRAIQSLTFEIVPSAHWTYEDLVHGGPMQNRYLHFNLNARMQGGWAAGLSYFQESFGYDPSIFTNYGLLHPDGSITPFTGGNDRLPNHDYVASFNTPAWRHFDFAMFVLGGLTDENYFEWARGRIVTGSLSADYKPTDKLRFNLSYNHTQVFRPSDGSRVVTQIVPVFTAIYQLSRAVQLRVISQYALNDQDSLRDDSRTNLPIVLRGADGTYSRASAFTSGVLQTNFLFTFLPNPGTVAYLGYGTVDQRPDLDGRALLGPTQSSFFLKVSYLFRRQ
ncbi:MAG TPA: DUF5916 domain-containing protein [Gemmatimonadales bacterium]|jgi:hypothetical protein